MAYASRSLTKSEQNFSQLEKEALAIVFSIKKFHQYVYGRKFILQTDHKPLTMILGSKSKLPTLAAARVQRWAILLSAYEYEIEYRPTEKHGNADGLSRLPLQSSVCSTAEKAIEATLFNLSQIALLPPTPAQLRRSTKVDPVLSKVHSYLVHGRPEQKDENLKPYYLRRDEMTIEAGCLLWGMRVVLPSKYRDWILQELHSGHVGMVCMKALARGRVWWPKLNESIEEVCCSCSSCQSVRKRPAKYPIHPWNWSSRLWECIHIDFASPFLNQMFFIVVDARSKWLEVIPMHSTSADKTIQVLRHLFSSYGLPNQIVSDNGPQFTSEEFKTFLRQNGIRQILIPPYHPSSNGEAEHFVQTFKLSLKAAKLDPGTMQEKLDRFLLSYCYTPNSTTGSSPAELFLGCSLRTRLDIIRPSIQDRVGIQQDKQQISRGRKERVFEVDEQVMVQNFMGKAKWVSGKIVKKISPTSYLVRVGDRLWRRHIDHILSCATKLPDPIQEDSFSELIEIGTNSSQQFDENSTWEPPSQLRYPRHNRHPPDRLTY